MWIFLLVLLAAAVILEIISLRQGTRYLSGDFRAVPDRIEPGETLQLTFRMANSGALPVTHAELDISTPLGSISETFRLRGHRQKTSYQSLSAQKRGVYQMKTAHINRGDFLGITESSSELSMLREFLVFPEEQEFSELEDDLLRFTGEMISRQCLNRDPILTLGLREYTGQEPMKTISWNATARMGEIMVREFEYTGEISCCLLMMISGLRPKEDFLLDTMASLSRGICRTLADKGFDVNFYTNSNLTGLPGRYASCRPSRDDMGSLLETLARASDFKSCSGEDLTEYALRALGNDCSFILLVAREDEASAQCLKKLETATRGAVLLINAQDFYSEKEDQA